MRLRTNSSLSSLKPFLFFHSRSTTKNLGNARNLCSARADSHEFKNRNGFTLVELLIVIVVIAILAAITIVAYTGVQSRAHASVLQNDVAEAVQQLETYNVQNGNYPDLATGNGLLDPSGGTTFTYVPAGASPINYCLQATGNGLTYFATNILRTPQVGSCPSSNGLVGWWPLDGNTNDASSTGANGVNSGAVPTTGQNNLNNSAYNFNGTNNYISIPAELPSSLSALTVSGWEKGVHTTDWGYVIHRGVSTTVGDSVFALGDNTGYYSGNVNGASAGNYGSTGVAATSSTWHLLTLTYDGTNEVVYLDGVSKYTVAVGAITNATTGTKVGIGGTPWNATYRPFSGAIDDVRIYNRALSQAEVLTLYNDNAQ